MYLLRENSKENGKIVDVLINHKLSKKNKNNNNGRKYFTF
jgi:hypothetical protein